MKVFGAGLLAWFLLSVHCTLVKHLRSSIILMISASFDLMEHLVYVAEQPGSQLAAGVCMIRELLQGMAEPLVCCAHKGFFISELKNKFSTYCSEE